MKGKTSRSRCTVCGGAQNGDHEICKKIQKERKDRHERLRRGKTIFGNALS